MFFGLIGIYLILGVIPLSGELTANNKDLLFHGMAYCLLMTIAILAFQQIGRPFKLLLGLFAYSMIIEFIQHFLPYRSFSVLDLLANGVGLVLGWGLACLWALCQKSFLKRV